MKLIASTYCCNVVPVDGYNAYMHEEGMPVETIDGDCFDTVSRTAALCVILQKMAALPLPSFHSETVLLFRIGKLVVSAVLTSSGNILVHGNTTDEEGDTLTVLACNATRGRVLQDFPNLKEVFPDEWCWDVYESTGPMWYSNDSTIQKLSDWLDKGYGVEDLDFYPEYSILPWEDHADYLIRTREVNNSDYVTEVSEALKAVAFTNYYSPDELVRTVKDGTFYNGNLKGYQRKLLNLHFAGDDERTASAARFVKAIAEIELAERCNLFA